MSTDLRRRIGQRVAESYNSLRSIQESGGAISKSLTASAQIGAGHPHAADLTVGQKYQCNMASVFLDIGNFTRRTRLENPMQAADVAHAVLSGFTVAIHSMGGHVLGLRGDGVFAGFGPTEDPKIAVLVAAAACAAALDGAQTSINPWLALNGIDTITARAGVDYGPAVFIRSGSQEVNEVNVIGFNTNFAAKCEKEAKAWEIVVGEDFAKVLDFSPLLKEHSNSPKYYTHNGRDFPYKFFNYSWSGLTSSLAEDIAGKPLESVF